MIRVGDFFTGQMEYLTFINDHDSGASNAEERSRDIDVFEVPQSPVDFRYVDVGSYGGSNQDVTGDYTVEDDGAALYLSGNTWKAIPFSYNVTSNTKMTFDFQSSVEGEIQAIGLDDDLVISPDRVFQLYGTQTWGIGDFKNYSATAPGWKSYEIPVGNFFTGTVNYITFINDHDSSNPNALGVFKNVKVFENPPSTLPENSALASQFTGSQGIRPLLADDLASIWRPDPASDIDGATRAYDHFYGNDQSQASLIDCFYGNGQSQTGPQRGAAFAQGPVAIGPERGKQSSESPAPFRNLGYGRPSIDDTIRDQMLEDSENWDDLRPDADELELLYEIMAVDR